MSEFFLDSVFVFNRYKSDFCPAVLKVFQLIDIFLCIPGQSKLAGFFDNRFFQFQIFALFRIDVFEMEFFVIEKSITSFPETCPYFVRIFLGSGTDFLPFFLIRDDSVGRDFPVGTVFDRFYFFTELDF